MEKTPTQVLLVEDNPADVVLLREALREDTLASFHVKTTDRLQTGIKFLQGNHFDVILLDLGLPDSQGLDTFIKLHKAAPDTPTIVLSGLMDEELALDAIQFGAQDYLVKRQEAWETAARSIRYAIERQRSKAALRESENRFRTLFEHTPVAYQSLDANGTYLDFNSQLCELVGYDPDELIGKSFGEILSPGTRSAFPGKFARFIRDGKMEADLQLLKKDGTEIEVTLEGKIQYDLDGQVVKTHCILHDITTRKIAEQAIRESQERFGTVFRSNPIGISITDLADGTLIDVNDAYLNLFGYTRAQLIGKTTLELNLWNNPEDRATVVGMLRHQGKISNLELKFNTKSGEIRNVLVSAELIELGGKQHILSMFNDITGIKKADKAREEVENKYRLLVERLPVVIYTSDLGENGVWHYVSPEIEHLLGFTPKEWMADPGLWYRQIHPEDRDKQEALEEQSLMQGEPFVGEYRIFARDGRQIWIRDSAKILPPQQGNTPIVQGILQDITEHKQMNEVLHESEDRFSKVFHSSPVPMSISTLVEGHIVDINVSYLSLTGFRYEELIGKSVMELGMWVDKDHRARLIERLKVEKSIKNEEIQFFTANGDIRHALASYEVIDLYGQACLIGIFNDITERKQTEDALRVNAEAMMMAQSIGHFGSWEMELNGSLESIKSIRWSDECYRIFGFEPGSVEVTTELIKHHTHPDDLGPALEALGKIVQERTEYSFEFRVIRSDGSIRTIHDRARVIADEQTNPFIKVIGIVQDISERKQTEEALQRGESELQVILESTADGILAVDNEGKVIKTNKRFRELWHIPESLIDSKDDNALLNYVLEQLVTPEEFLAKVRFLYNSFDEETDILHFKDGRVFERYSTPLIISESIFGRVWSFRDITFREQAEKSLHESEQWYRTLFEDTPVAIWEEDFSEVKKYLDSLKEQGITDFRALFASHPEVISKCSLMIRVLNVNKTALQMFRAESKEQLIEVTNKNSSSGEMEHNHEDFIAIAEGRTSNSWEGVDETFTDESIEISLSWSVVPGYEKDYSKIIVTTSDITERKRAEKALQESELRFRTLVTQIPAIVYIDDVSNDPGLKQFVSPYIEAMLGFTPEEWIKGGVELYQAQIHPHDRKRVLDEYKKSIQGGTPFDLEYRLIARDERVVWVHDQATPLRDTTGTPQSVHGIIYNITERKEAETALRDSEERYHSLFEHMMDGVYRSTHEGRFVDVNPALVKMFGYSSKQEMLDVDIKNELYFTPEERGSHILDTGQEEMDIYLMRRKDGSAIWVEDHGSYVHDEQGRIIYHEGLLRDITERKITEARLRDSETRFRSLFDDSPISLWEEDFSAVKRRLDGLRKEGVTDFRTYLKNHPHVVDECASLVKILNVNKTALNLYRAESKEALLKNLTTILGRFENELVNIADGKVRFNWDAKNKTLTGEELDVNITWSAIPNHEGDLSRVIVSTFDITEHKRMEESLRESEERFGNAFEYAPIGMSLVAPDGHWLKINQAICEITGYTEQELLQITFQEITHPDDLEADLNYFNQMLAGEIPSYQMEKRYLHKSGETVWVLLSVSMVRDVRGEPQYFISQIQDITKRKRAEADIEHHLSELEVLYENGLAINGLLEPNRIAQKLVEALDRKLAWHHAAIRLYHPETDHLELLALSQPGLSEPQIRNEIERINHVIGNPDKGLSGWVLRHGTSVRSGNLREDPRYVETYSSVHSGLYIPIQTGDQIIGSIAVESEKENAFTEQDERLLTTLANQAAIAFVNTRLYLSLQQELGDRLRAEENVRNLNIELEQRVVERTAEIESTRQRLEIATKAAELGVWDWDVKSDHLVWDAQMYSIYDMNTESFDGTFDSFLSIVHPDDVAHIKNLVVAVLHGEKQYQIQYRIIRGDGSIGYIEAHGAIIYGSEGNIDHLVGVIQDITLDKLSEQILRDNEEQDRLLFEESPDAVILLDVNGIMIRANRAYEELVGLPRNTLLGHTADELGLMSKKERERVLGAIFQALYQGDSFAVVEFSIQRTDATVRDVESRAYSLLLKGEQHILVTLRDITKRNQAEQALRESEAYARLLFEASPDPISVAKFDGEMVDINRIFEQQHGVIKTDIIGRNLAEINIFPPDEVAKAGAYIEDIMQNKKREPVELDYLHPSGSIHTLEMRSYLITASDRQLILSTSRDITTHKQAEETLRMANSELERALRVKDEFLANMSHELRTPLNAILGLSESLEEQIAGSLNEKQIKYIHTISESGHHLLTLINDILDLAKIEAGQITLDINKVDIHAITQSSLRMIKQLAQKKRQSVELKIDDNIGLIWADERRLKQMLVNLLSNAVKFTPDEGKIGLEIHGDREENKVVMTIMDTGIGIKESDLARLFQPFVQLDSSLSRETAGTGLGLALVAQMARLHGGSVSVSSQPGQGSRFTITLPWEPALASDTITKMKITGKFRAVKPGYDNNRQTILVVEDTDEVVMMLRDYLESAGYKVTIAKDGLDGIAQARSIHPQLILMDVMMPGMDGLEATQRIRSEPALSQIPIIGLTALAMPSDRERCLAAGMDEYMSKPINLKALLKTIKAFLANAEEARS